MTASRSDAVEMLLAIFLGLLLAVAAALLMHELARAAEPTGTAKAEAKAILKRAAPVTYPVLVQRVVDGDTIKVLVLVWPNVMVDATVRLADVNAPELRGAKACERDAARKAKAFVEAFLSAGDVTLQVDGRGEKYGRVLGRVVVGGRDLSESLIESGNGRAYAGGRRGAWC